MTSASSRLNLAVRLQASLVALFLVGGFPATAVDVVAEKVEGRVLVRSPISLAWYEVVRDMVIPVGSLVQIRSGASLQILFRFYPGDSENLVQGSTARLTLNQPTVLRVSPDVIRNVHLERKAISPLKADLMRIAGVRAQIFKAPDATATPKNQGHSFWQSAFERIKVTVLGDSQNVTAFFKPSASSEELRRQQKSFAIQIGQNEMEWLQPGEFERQETTVPTRLQFRWLRPEGLPVGTNVVPAYNVYFWSATKDRPSEPQARTNSEHYSLPVYAYGPYWAQVESSDRKFITAPHRIDVVPVGGSSADRPDATTLRRAALPHPRHPATDTLFTLAPEEANRRVQLSWENPRGEPLEMEIVEASSTVEKILEYPAPTQHTRELLLPPGTYRWIGRSSPRQRREKRPQVYWEVPFVIKPTQKLRLDEIFQTLNDPTTGQNVVYFLDSGL